MKSRTKNHLTDEKIRELLRIHFGSACEADTIEELEGGMFNAIYRIGRKREKDRIILKVGVVPGTPLLTYEQDVMPTEVECYRLIRRETGVPVPEILACDFSKKYIASNYFFMTELTGQPLSEVMRKMDGENLKKIRRELAGYLEQIHRIHGSYFGYFTEDPGRRYGTWREAFFAMFAQILDDAREHGVRLPYHRIENVLKEKAYCLDALREPSLVEYDCHEGNIFVKRSEDGAGEYVIEGIIDFERAWWGDPLADFPAAFVLTDDIRKEKDFLDSYLEASGRQAFTEEDAVRCQMYRMYLMVIMASETFRYSFPYSALQGFWAKAQVRKCLKYLETEKEYPEGKKRPESEGK